MLDIFDDWNYKRRLQARCFHDYQLVHDYFIYEGRKRGARIDLICPLCMKELNTIRADMGKRILKQQRILKEYDERGKLIR